MITDQKVNKMQEGINLKQTGLSRPLALLIALALCAGMIPATRAAVLPEGLDQQNKIEGPGTPAEDGVTVEQTDEAGGTGTDLLAGPDTSSAITEVRGWKMQIFGGNTDLEIPEGAVVPADDGIGVTIDYNKIFGSTAAPSGNVTVYYEAPNKYADSVLEFTLNMLGEESGRFRFAVFPHYKNGQNCDGIAIDTPSNLQHSYRINNTEKWPGITNLLGLSFQTGTDYQVKLITADGKMTMYVDGKKLTDTAIAADLGETTFGFRVWGPEECKDLKKLQLSNVSFSEYIRSAVDSSLAEIKEANWGTADLGIPVTIAPGDSVSAIKNGDTALELGTDYTVSDNSITINAAYIAGQKDTFTLNINFSGGVTAPFTVAMKRGPAGPFSYVEDFSTGGENWVKQSGSGTVALEEGALRIAGDALVLDTASPYTVNGEAEFVIETLTDNGHFGLVFRAGDGAWQSIYNSESAKYQYATGTWNYRNSTGANTALLNDGTPVLQRPAGINYTMKVRFWEDTLTLWMDGNPIYCATLSEMPLTSGLIGIQTGSDADILIKRVTYRNYETLGISESGGTKTLSKDGLTVTLAANFPQVISYQLDGKSMDGCVLPKHYVSINGTDYPASAEVTAETAESLTYSVTVQDAGVAFDTVFTVLEQNILDMKILNIDESMGMVYTIGFPEQPLISAQSSQQGASFDAATRGADVNLNLGTQSASKKVNSYATIAIVSTNGLSASMYNNVFNNRMEYSYRSFDLENGDVTTGVWNTDFFYRGLDEALILPNGEAPSCQIIVTGDTNGDSSIDWQDGANALKRLVGGTINGGEVVQDSMIHVGYNFVSEAQQPFLKIADNMKRLGNLMDGFEQILVFKGYANEGHDSGHSDFADINKRAGGSEDLIKMTDAIEGIGTFGIHVNHSEAYPEAKMFTDEVMSTKNGWGWMDQSKYIRREVDIMSGGMEERLSDLFTNNPGIGFVYVDTYRDDRYAAAKLAQSLTGTHDVILGTEEAGKLDRWAAWAHWADGRSTIHGFVFHTQKDVYGDSDLFWGGYSRSTSMMSWQHNWNINAVLEQFYTNQLPQKYLMNHEVLRQTDSAAYFEDNVRSESGKKIYKDDHLIADGAGKIFIPWFAEDSATRNPDEAAKIYHWNAGGGETTWYLPVAWSELSTVKLYRTTQTGKVLVADLAVTNGQVTVDAQAKTPYVLYPGEAIADTTEWSVGSPLKDTSFNSRDFSIWQASSTSGSTSHIKITDDGNGVAILTMEGTEDGCVQQVMTGLVPGHKYRALVWAGAENGKTARITVVTPDGKTHTNYTEQITRPNNCYDTYASNKRVQRIWVDFIQPMGEDTTAIFTLSADACQNENGQATFMESRVLKTADPGLPTDDATRNYVAYETFEYIEQGGTGIFTPEGGGDGGYHLSETHLPYTDDTISANGSNWSLKMYGHGSAKMRTYPATMRLAPNTDYTMEFDTLGGGTVYIVSEADGSDQPLKTAFSEGHSEFTFTTGGRTDYIARFDGGRVLDNFQVYSIKDETPPTIPANLLAVAGNKNQVVLTWDASIDEDTRVSGYNIYRDGVRIGQVGAVTTFTDSDVASYTGYSYQVSAVNAAGTESEKSAPSQVFVGADTTAPVIISAVLDHLSQATLTFNKALERTSAETASNYHVSGGVSVTGATLSANGKVVTLALSGMSATDIIILRSTGVEDTAANATHGDQSVILSALIRYLKLDETEGETAADFMGAGNGIKASTVTSTDGKNGGAAQFNGNGYVDLASDTLHGLDEYSVSMWFNWKGNTSESNTIFSNNTSGLSGSPGIWLRINNGGIITADNLSSGSITTTKGAAANTWNHLVVVRRTDGTDIYLNGEQVGTGTSTIRLGDNRIRIGGNFNASGDLLHKFRGAIDEFRIYACALSPADVSALATEDYAPAVIGSNFAVIAGAQQPLDVKVNFNGNGLSTLHEGQTLLSSNEDYTLSDSTVTFRAEYLSGLDLGDHTYSLTFDDQSSTKATLTISVVEKHESVDRTLLMKTIYFAQQLKQDDYPGKETQWSNLQAAIEAALEASENTALTAEQVIEEAAKLQSAIDALTVVAPSRTEAPTFERATATFPAESDSVLFTLTGTPVDAYTVYADAEDGEALTDPVVSAEGNILTLTFTVKPEVETVYHVSATETAAGKTESLRTAVTVKPYEAPASSEKDIVSFTIPSQVGESVIDQDAHTVVVTMPEGTDVTALVPEITVSAGASVSPASGVAQDFTNSVAYTVTAENGTTQVYTATVSVNETPTVEVTGVSIDPSSYTLYMNRAPGSVQLTATVTPADATNKTVTWTSSDEAVARVADGLVTAVAEGSATITVTTEDGGFTATCEVTVTNYTPPYVPPTGGGSTTDTVKNEDGSTTKTVTNKITGMVIETTTYPNGDKTVVETQKDGTVTETVTRKDGYKSETVTKPDGSFTSKVTDAGGAKTETVATAEGEITASVTLPKDVESAKVTVPVKDAVPGTVAVTVNENGTESIIKTSVVTGDGLSFIAEGNIEVKVIDNSKTFADVAESHWASDPIQFVASREIFTGTGSDVFDPMGDMTRAMLVTVLARLDGQDTEGGETWYSKAMEWGMENGITDGTNVEASITRESLAVMLYRYAKAEKTQADLSGFADTDRISDWASDAMNWAVAEGIITGKTGSKLDPSGLASRAEVAAMLQRFIENTLK